MGSTDNKKTISSLINDAGRLKIKDYAKVDYIFKLYLDENYDKMAREIYWYKQFLFFIDLCLFLDDNFRYELRKQFYYKDIWDLFEERQDMIWNEIQLKKERKKYGL